MASKTESFWNRDSVRGIALAVFTLVSGLIVATYEHWLGSDAAPASTSTEQALVAPWETPTSRAAVLAVTATTAPTQVPAVQPTRRPEPTPTPAEETDASQQRRWDSETGFTNWPESRTWDIADGFIIRNDDVEQVAYMSPADLDRESAFRLYVTFDDVPSVQDVARQDFGVVIENEASGTRFLIGVVLSPNPGQSFVFVEYFDGTQSNSWLNLQLSGPLEPGRVRLDVTVNAGTVVMTVNGQEVLRGSLIYRYETDRVGVFATTPGVRVTELIISAT